MRAHFVLAWSVTVLLVHVGGAWADLPQDQTVQFAFHVSPANPNSVVDFYVIATLHAVDSDVEDIGWRVTLLEFVYRDGVDNFTWTQEYPTLDTGDGLWWVSHGDAQNPELDEFLTTPLLTGTATADSPGYADLDYELISVPAVSSTPYETTASVTYAMAAAGTNEPVKGGTDEPVEATKIQAN
ncbi:hypothetical protein [Nitrospira sp. BLG_2]|uniref:hypothetical protein n=1 Tax=Nitrospira sp. BLG_2 TaxID=3397507 RepID=UPI003B9CB10F